MDEVELLHIEAHMHSDEEGGLCLHARDPEAGIEIVLQVSMEGLKEGRQHPQAASHLHGLLTELPEAFYGILESYRRGEGEGLLMMPVRDR